MATVALAGVTQLPTPEQLKPEPRTTTMEVKSEPVTLEAAADAPVSKLPFDPVALKNKYLEERDKRLRANNEGVDQYRMVEGSLSHYIEDPYLGEIITREPIDEEVDVVIVGGGYGAQLVAVRLQEAGIKNFRILEKGGDFGGTWYWNRYPGAQCDIESYVYMPLLDETNYVPTEKYARAKELLQHAEMIGKRYGLYEKTLFQTEVKAIRWDETSARWTAETNRGDTIRASFAIPAAGPLHRPKLPGLSGIELYKGHSFHSSRWDYEYTGGDPTGGLEKLKDKRVGIIGTGATAVQIVPHLGAWCKETVVFQRTPSSIDVRGNRPTDLQWVSTLEKGWQKRRMDNFNIIVNGGRQDEDLVSDGWTDILRELLVRPKEGDTASPEELAQRRQITDFKKMEQIRSRVDKIVKDKKTAESLKPYYNQFCKRPCFHDEYLGAFNLPTVTLIDTQGQGVDAITEKGVVANGEEYELDCIIYATGFELATDWSHRSGMEIYGRDGQTITEKWRGGASTLHGWTSRGFPNCFFVSIVQAALTPNFIHITGKYYLPIVSNVSDDRHPEASKSALGLFSEPKANGVLPGEQANHLAYVIKTCKERNIRTIEPTQEAEDHWVDTILKMGSLRAEFNKECTPGYYNNEGKPSPVAARNASYGGGALSFIEILEKWRGDDKFDGLDVVKRAPATERA